MNFLAQMQDVASSPATQGANWLSLAVSLAIFLVLLGSAVVVIGVTISLLIRRKWYQAIATLAIAGVALLFMVLPIFYFVGMRGFPQTQARSSRLAVEAAPEVSSSDFERMPVAESGSPWTRHDTSEPVESNQESVRATASAWSPEVDAQFDFDVYYDRLDAVNGLAIRVARRLEKPPFNGESANAEATTESEQSPTGQSESLPQPVITLVTTRDDSFETSTEFLERLRHRLPERSVRLKVVDPLYGQVLDEQRADEQQADEQQTKKNATENAVLLSIQLRKPSMSRGGKQAKTRGWLSCEMTLGNTTDISKVSFETKSWMQDPLKVEAGSDGKRQVVGYSERLETTAQAARESALADARRQILKRDFDLLAEAASRYRLNTVVTDSFVQRLSRPYGDTWRAAVLVEYAGYEAVAGSRMMVPMAERTHWFKIENLIALLLSTTVFCAVANWLTDGYYQSSFGRNLKWILICIGILLALVALSTVG